VLPELIENTMKSDNVTVAIGKLFADDGAYDSNDILRQWNLALYQSKKEC
jgi:hypothetical protein